MTVTQYAVKVKGEFVTGWSQNRSALTSWAKALRNHGTKNVRIVKRRHKFAENPAKRSGVKRLQNFTGTVTVRGGRVTVKGVQR